MYGRLEEADPLIEQLTSDKDPILRRSGMYTLAMAYCGTGHNQAIRKLLHVAVSIRAKGKTRVLNITSLLIIKRVKDVRSRFLVSWKIFTSRIETRAFPLGVG